MEYPNTQHKDLERDIFGAGSDLSDSDSEREQRKPQRKDKPKPIRRQTAELSSAPESEDYVREKSAKTKKRRPRAPAGETGAGGAEDGAPKKKRKKKAASPQPDVPLTQEEERRLRLDQSIKDILQPSKRAKKRTKKNEDDLDKIADDFVMGLREEMMQAANDDKKAHADGLPAVSKLRLLDRVMDTLQKRQYNTAVMDQDLLGACKVWLEPLDAKSLPALNIQKAFFDHFVKMNIDTETLRESGLGRVVLFYTKCKRVIEPIRRIASQLVDTWTRPILKRSSSYRDKLIPTITQEEMDTAPKSIPKLSVILQQAKMADLGAGKTMRRHAVAVPERNLTEYKVAPRFSQSLMAGRGFGEDALANRRVNKEMLKRLQKRQDGKGEKV